MTDDDFLLACDLLMETLVDAGCKGCAVSASLASRNVEVALWNSDVETVADLIALGLEAQRAAAR